MATLAVKEYLKASDKNVDEILVMKNSCNYNRRYFLLISILKMPFTHKIQQKKDTRFAIYGLFKFVVFIVCLVSEIQLQKWES